MSLKSIAENDCMLDVDEAAWQSIVERRGGCRCHASPPCNNCAETVTEEELNAVGYTYAPAAPADQHLPADDTEGGAA